MDLGFLTKLNKATLKLYNAMTGKDNQRHIVGYGPGTRPLGVVEKVTFYHKMLSDFPPEPLKLNPKALYEAAQLAGWSTAEVQRRLNHWPPMEWLPDGTVLESIWVTAKRWEEGGPEMLREIEQALERVAMQEVA